jgi:hypothetical protein
MLLPVLSLALYRYPVEPTTLPRMVSMPLLVGISSLSDRGRAAGTYNRLAVRAKRQRCLPFVQVALHQRGRSSLAVPENAGTCHLHNGEALGWLVAGSALSAAESIGVSSAGCDRVLGESVGSVVA